MAQAFSNQQVSGDEIDSIRIETMSVDCEAE
jgi:hypothetical protein